MTGQVSPYRPSRIRATFETWIVPEKPESGNAFDSPTARCSSQQQRIAQEIPGTYVIEIRLCEQGRRSIYRAYVMPTLQALPKVFPISALDECKSDVLVSFRRQLTEWEEI